MGSCWCKQKDEESDSYAPSQTNNHFNVEQIQAIPNNTLAQYNLESPEKVCVDPQTVDHLVLETLGVIGTLVDK